MPCLIITGTRDRSYSRSQFLTIFTRHLQTDSYVILGDCPTGIDRYALDYVKEKGIAHNVHIANWYPNGKYWSGAGPLRNSKMIEEAVVWSIIHPSDQVLCLAFPKGNSPGTRNCISLAKRSGIEVEVIEWQPDGYNH
jgi:hypothetical protein